MNPGMKDRILKGATKLYRNHGFSGVRIDDIAAFLGISKKTIYNHFPGKSALIQAVIELNVLNICQRLETFTTDEALNRNSLDQIHSLMVFGYQEISSGGWLFKEDTRNGHFRDLVEDSLELIRDKIICMAGKYLDRGIQDGMIRSDVSKEILPYIIAIIVEGIFQLHRYSGIRVKGDELFKEAMKMIYEGILTAKGKEIFHDKW